MFDSESAFGRWQLFELESLFKGSLLTMGIVKNNSELVKQGLEQGESPNKRYTYEENNDSITVPNPVYTITPIVQAAVMGSLPISKLLVEYGADVNLCQSNGESALANAANRGNVELVSFLLEHGADPNLRKSFGTPLAFADGVAVMRVLLDHGADPNIPDDDGDLPIIGSIDANSLDEIELLVRYGTDLSYANKQGETPLDRAKRRGNFGSVVAFAQAAEQGGPDAGPASSNGPASPSELPELSAACVKGDFEKAISLLDSGADPNERSADGRTPLFYCKEVAFVCLLEHFGADVNATDALGNTPLVQFLTGDNSRRNCERAIMFLIEAGADVDAKNDEGLSVREIAQSVANRDIKAAFEQGLGVAEKKRRRYEDMLGRQKNRREGWHEECRPLEPADSRERAVINCVNACAFSDLDVLKASEDFVQSNLSVRIGPEGANRYSMLMMACINASVEVVEYLISLGANVNQIDDEGQISLHYAAISWRDAAEKINALANAGADVNHRNNDGLAALSNAACVQNVAAAKALIAHGADVGSRDNQGYSAISWTCARETPEAEIVELLLRDGADVRDLYATGCVLQYADYDSCNGYGVPREGFLRPQDLRERHLYEHSLIPAWLSEQGGHHFLSHGFVF